MPTRWQYANEWIASERRICAQLEYSRQRKVGEEEVVSEVWKAAGPRACLAGGDSAPLLLANSPSLFPRLRSIAHAGQGMIRVEKEPD